MVGVALGDRRGDPAGAHLGAVTARVSSAVGEQRLGANGVTLLVGALLPVDEMPAGIEHRHGITADQPEPSGAGSDMIKRLSHTALRGMAGGGGGVQSGKPRRIALNPDGRQPTIVGSIGTCRRQIRWAGTCDTGRSYDPADEFATFETWSRTCPEGGNCGDN